MIINRTFYNIECDHCGALIDEETWWDDKNILTTDILNECNWIKCEGGHHYCDECWEYDDDDNIVTKDGHKWDGDTHKEILAYRLHFLDDMDETLTLTQFRIKLVRAEALFRSMRGVTYKRALAEELKIADEMFRRMISERYYTDEYNRYETFLHRGIFQLIEYDYYTNISKA